MQLLGNAISVTLIGATLSIIMVSAAGVRAQPLNQNDSVFFSGNDIYSECQTNRSMALSYAAGLSDMAAHSSFVIDMQRDSRNYNARDARADQAIEAISNFCRPKEATLDQVTDVLCKYLREAPDRRHVVGPIIFNEAMKTAWPCTKP